jgi:hypothetical protein
MKTIGEYYREKVLSLSEKELVTVELPTNGDECRIEKDLFGWKLYSGKDFVDCRSGEEARYIKVFLEAGMTEVSVPKDDEYLKLIVTELESLKKRIDEIINSYLDSVLNRQVREKVRREVFLELAK